MENFKFPEAVKWGLKFLHETTKLKNYSFDSLVESIRPDSIPFDFSNHYIACIVRSISIT